MQLDTTIQDNVVLRKCREFIYENAIFLLSPDDQLLHLQMEPGLFCFVYYGLSLGHMQLLNCEHLSIEVAKQLLYFHESVWRDL